MKAILLTGVFAILTVFTTVLNAQIVSVMPDTAVQGEPLNIVVTVDNIDFTQGSNVLSFIQGNEKVEADNGKAISPSIISINHTFNSGNPTGHYALLVYNNIANKTFEKQNVIFVKPDETIALLDSVVPNNAYNGKTFTLAIYGTQTNFIQAGKSNQVYLLNKQRRIRAKKITPVNPETLVAEFELAFGDPAGLYSIQVSNTLDGVITIPSSFEVIDNPKIPFIESISPDSAEQGKTLEIEISLQNIDFKQGSNMVYFKQGNDLLYNRITNIATDSSITINQIFSPDRPLGYYDMFVYNDELNFTMEKQDAIFLTPDEKPAMLKGISPGDARQGDLVALTIEGENLNLYSNDITTNVYLKNNFKSIKAKKVYPLNSETLLAEFEITYAHAKGLYGLEVYNELDGTNKLLNAFEVLEGPDVPHILEVKPDTMTLGQTLDVEITAENLDFTQGSNVVHLEQGNNRIKMNSSSAISKAVLKANITVDKSAPIGDYNISIYNTSFDILLVSDYTLIKEKALFLKSASIIDAVNEPLEDPDLFYPNPAEDVVFIRNPVTVVKLFDLNGKMVLESYQKETIDISMIPKGIYVIKQEVGGKTMVQKVIID